MKHLFYQILQKYALEFLQVKAISMLEVCDQILCVVFMNNVPLNLSQIWHALVIMAYIHTL